MTPEPPRDHPDRLGAALPFLTHIGLLTADSGLLTPSPSLWPLVAHYPFLPFFSSMLKRHEHLTPSTAARPWCPRPQLTMITGHVVSGTCHVQRSLCWGLRRGQKGHLVHLLPVRHAAGWVWDMQPDGCQLPWKWKPPRRLPVTPPPGFMPLLSTHVHIRVHVHVGCIRTGLDNQQNI